MSLSRTGLSPWHGLTFDEPSKGVIACDGDGHGCVLWAFGAHLRFEVEEAGFHALGDLGLDDAPQGVSIWEGMYMWEPGGWENPQDGETFPQGTFRNPTDDEWLAIRAGRCPWADDFKAPGSGSASAEAVPGDSVADHHAGDADILPAPSASSPHPSQEPLSLPPWPYVVGDDPVTKCDDSPEHRARVRAYYRAFNDPNCPVCHRPLPLCEC